MDRRDQGALGSAPTVQLTRSQPSLRSQLGPSCLSVPPARTTLCCELHEASFPDCFSGTSLFSLSVGIRNHWLGVIPRVPLTVGPSYSWSFLQLVPLTIGLSYNLSSQTTTSVITYNPYKELAQLMSKISSLETLWNKRRAWRKS
jgi:hypothetical protein